MIHTWRADWNKLSNCNCDGYWKLYYDNEEVDTEIPFYKEPANTYGEYETYSLDDNYNDYWYTYEDGLDKREWIERYRNWLSSFADESEWSAIYDAFSLNDWRPLSCGYCI